MKPVINKTSFGSITIETIEYSHDVIICLNGEVKKRKKKLSKEVFGTSHRISLDEAEHVYQDGSRKLIIGAGQSGMVKLSDEAADFFKHKGCKVQLMPTAQAILAWNEAEGAVIGLFHITC